MPIFNLIITILISLIPFSLIAEFSIHPPVFHKGSLDNEVHAKLNPQYEKSRARTQKTPFHSKKSLDQREMAERIWNQYFKNLTPRDQKWVEESKASLHQLRERLNNSKAVKSDFKRIKDISPYFKRESSVGASAENLNKNRYSGILPFDDTLSLRHISDFYWAASDVITEEQIYIVTQAPLEHTLKDFWRGIGEAGVTTIVTLMSPSEKKKNCPAYYNRHNFPFSTKEWSVDFTEERQLAQSSVKSGQKIIERVFSVRNKDSGGTRSVRHIHFEEWPDGGSPDMNLFMQLLEIVDQRQSPMDPILVHCAAGVGRSGMFVLGHTLRRQILRSKADPKNIYLNPVKTLLCMRMQRMKLVSTENQYVSTLEVLKKSF